RLLGQLAAGAIRTRLVRQDVLAQPGANILARPGNGLLSDVDRVSTHVRDQTAMGANTLVQLLGNNHGAPRGEAEFAAGLLLQGAGGKRSIRVALLLTFAYSGHAPPGAIEVVLNGNGFDASVEVDLLAGALDQAGSKSRRIRPLT